MEGKVVVVTGGAAGIGLEMVLALARQGWRVVAADVARDALTVLAGKLNDLGLAQRVRLEEVDLSQAAAAPALIKAVEEWGPIHGLVNNAGLGRSIVRRDFFTRPPKFWDMEMQTWLRYLALHATAPFALMKAVVPAMLQRGVGRIVNVTTSLDSMLNAGAVGYGPSKAAAEALSAVAANDLRGTGITVNVLIPGGVVDTGMIPAEAPLARDSMLRPECMCAPLLWLLSDAAADTTAVRIRAHLWDAEAGAEASLRMAGAPIAWTSLTGQLRAAKFV